MPPPRPVAAGHRAGRRPHQDAAPARDHRAARNRFQLLRRPSSSGTARHDGLEAAIDWSYDLLFDDERRTFRRLAVFAGGVTIEAAEWLCGPDAFDLASRLVDRSLLVADTAGRAVRFGMLESLRAYGLDRLAETRRARRGPGRPPAVVHRARGARRPRTPAAATSWTGWRRLDEEHDNVLAALGYAVEHDPDGALRLIGGAGPSRGGSAGAARSRGVDRGALAAGADGSPPLLARVLALSGLVTEPTGRTAGGPAEGDDPRRAWRPPRPANASRRDVPGSGDDHDVATSRAPPAEHAGPAGLVRRAVDADEVGVLVDDAAARFDGLGDDFGSAVVRVTHAMFAIATGDLAWRRSSIEAALQHAERSGDRFSTSRIEYVLGMIDDLADDPQRAYRHIERSLRLADELGINQAVTAQARLLGPLAERCGEPELAATWRAFVADRSDGWSHYDATVMALARNHEGLGARAAGDPRRGGGRPLRRAVLVHGGRDPGRDRRGRTRASGSWPPSGPTASEPPPTMPPRSRRRATATTRPRWPSPSRARRPSSVEPVVVARLLGAASALRSPSSAAPTHRADVAATAEAARRGWERRPTKPPSPTAPPSIVVAPWPSPATALAAPRLTRLVSLVK